MLLRRFFLLCLLVVPGVSIASHCGKVLANDKLIECLGEDYDVADKRLNEVYKNLRAKLNENDKQSLRNSQRPWLKNRESDCDAEAAQVAGGQAYQPTYIQCQTNMTNSRIKLLNQKRW